MRDRLGASDCWLMFGLWAAAYDNRWAALIAFTLCALYTFLPLCTDGPAPSPAPKENDRA